MRKEELVQLGLSREQADGVLDIYVRESERAAEELERVRKELESQRERLAQYRSMDLEGLQREALEWKEKARQAAEGAEIQEQRRLIRERADKLYQKNGVRNGEVVDALVDWEKVSVDEKGAAGLDGQIAEIKGRYGYLFEPETPLPQFSAGMGGMPAADEARAVREAMGL